MAGLSGSPATSTQTSPVSPRIAPTGPPVNELVSIAAIDVFARSCAFSGAFQVRSQSRSAAALAVSRADGRAGLADALRPPCPPSLPQPAVNATAPMPPTTIAARRLLRMRSPVVSPDPRYRRPAGIAEQRRRGVLDAQHRAPARPL